MTKTASSSRQGARVRPSSGSASGESLGLAAYRALRAEIVTLGLRPGETLSEATLARTLGHGRAAIRVAIQRLQSERLVVVIPRGGTTVAHLTVSDIAQAYQVRTYLEILASRICSKRATPADLADMGAALDRAQKARQLGDGMATVRESHRFFQIIRQNAHNQLLEDFATITATLTERFENFCVREVHGYEPPFELHRGLLDAIRSRDPATAEGAVNALGNARAQTVASLLDTTLTVRERAPG